jgi:hypothetical protein
MFRLDQALQFFDLLFRRLWVNGSDPPTCLFTFASHLLTSLTKMG